MKVNYNSIQPRAPDSELSEHAEWLAQWGGNQPGVIGSQLPPQGYENFTVVDVLGNEFIWMNETFPREKFTWYLWFESVFLVPEEMIPFLRLRWS